jgi:hypothetical protein
MKYPDGQDVRIGDIIDLGNDGEGLVVCDIENRIGTIDYPISDWDYLKIGVMIYTKEFGLFHCDKFGEFVSLIRRTSD